VDAQRWLDELRAELARNKLPPFYVERLVSELSDHVTDFMEDRMSTDAKDLHGVFQRLGAPGQVAASAASEFRKQRFSRRHPVLMFVVLPIVALPLLWCAKTALIIALIKLLGIKEGKVVGPWTGAAMLYAFVFATIVPVTIAALFFCRLAARAHVDRKWLLAACGLLAVVGGAAVTQLSLPTETTNGSLSFGFGFSPNPSPMQIAQFLAPLAICAWALWRASARRGAIPA